ncbi:MAG: MGH1-like glycoside hydrolase domain-containing protein, partial [Thermomicrobiales bacterium]
MVSARTMSTNGRRESISPEWRTWGPYLSERQWGTVREDYSPNGTAWDSFPHDHARSRAYRWGEDGLMGISDDQQRLCFALSLWNGQDSILKERLFGLTGSEGNHGEDVKEYYYYLDATPDHAYLKGLYKYPQAAFPYEELAAENRRRGRNEPEYELLDTGVFAEDRYFDVEVEYAKVSPEDIIIRISTTNRGPEVATLHVLPTLWYRNTWSWGRDDRYPKLRAVNSSGTRLHGGSLVQATHPTLGEYWLCCEGDPQLLFTENETNAGRLWGAQNRTLYVKDGIHEAVVHGHSDAVDPTATGTKVAASYVLDIESGATKSILLRLSSARSSKPFADAETILSNRAAEADTFYAELARGRLSEDEARVQRQALAGLIWTKQYYYYDVAEWLEGDPEGPQPPPERKKGRNSDWRHHSSGDVISMPDTWEYPWYAAWDLAFHCVAFGLVDPRFAKDQILLLERERFMHPNGQLPAYEWAFGDVNPPVHIAATRALYQAERTHTGEVDRDFLARVFHKLMLNFTWWVNRKDASGKNLFQGGFLGLDNISVIDRSMVLPANLSLEQADGTAWMATYCLNMAWAALELSTQDPVYEDLAVKFLEHFLAIGGALNDLTNEGTGLWDEEDGFYYDHICRDDGARLPLKIRSLVGLLPIVPAISIPPMTQEQLREKAPGVIYQMQWYGEHHPELTPLVPTRPLAGGKHLRLFTLVPEDRLRRILTRMFDPAEFLSDYGIRSISKHYEDHPYELRMQYTVLNV